MSNLLQKSQSIHFIGIGGIGISAIARMMLFEGKSVTGSDRDRSKITSELEKAGAKILIGQKAENILSDCDLVIYTVAVPLDNPELLEAKKRNIPLLSYPETLDLISKEKYTIAVSGTHGKTTTTAMIAKIMIDAGLDPTVIVGSLMKNPRGGESNFIAGKSKYLVVEADEYKKSFHNLHPKILVINNIDLDHLDFYKDLADIQRAFKELAERVPADGYILTDTKNPNIESVIKNVRATIVDCSVYVDEKIQLKIPGQHNKLNAGMARALADVLNIEDSKVLDSLKNFEGTWRRFEFKGMTKNGALVYDDYAHNPHKIKAALEGARELFPSNKIVVIFQPHLFSRTKMLLSGLIEAFDEADTILLTPIYPARELFDPTISSPMVALELEKRLGSGRAEAFQTFESVLDHIKKHFDTKGTVIITMGAGDGFLIGESLLES